MPRAELITNDDLGADDDLGDAPEPVRTEDAAAAGEAEDRRSRFERYAEAAQGAEERRAAAEARAMDAQRRHSGGGYEAARLVRQTFPDSVSTVPCRMS